jgi:hypothetical protein
MFKDLFRNVRLADIPKHLFELSNKSEFFCPRCKRKLIKKDSYNFFNKEKFVVLKCDFCHFCQESQDP